MMEERMFEDGFAEGGALFGVREGIGHGALGYGDAYYAVGYAGEVQDFEDQVDSGVGGAEQVGFAIAKFDFAGGDGAGGDFVFEAADKIVELAIFAAARYEEESQAADA